jgi:tetratricopeptide (TPR) repeat protein
VSATRDVMRIGAPAVSVIGSQAKTESAATSGLLQAIGQALKDKATAEGVDSAPAAIEPEAKKLVLAARELVHLKERALDPVKEALADPRNADIKDILAKAESRVYMQIVSAVMRSYFNASGSFSGTFDGMFDSLDKYDREKIGDAFLDVFQSASQPPTLRDLAGEGLAQKGTARHLPAVKAILGNANETDRLRQRAMYTMARLGDRSALDKQLAMIATRMESSKKPDMTPQETLQWAAGYYHSARHSQNAHDTDAAIKSYESFLGAIEPVREKLSELPPAEMQNIYYNLACLYSLKGDLEGGFKALEKAFQAGYSNFKWANTDGDLANLRKDARFKEMLGRYETGGQPKTESAPASRPS